MNINDTMYVDLPAKLQPFCLGHSKCSIKETNREELLQIFHNSTEIKPNIFTSDKWIFKSPRLEISQLPDTHLYRVLKAKKIRNYIQKNGLEEHIIVPQKFIIKNSSTSGLCSYIVVSEKIKLSEEVIKPTDLLEAEIKTEVNQVGQAKAFLEGKPQKELSIQQAKALAQLAFLGYTDQTYNNVFLTTEGKVAVLDTEPMHRSWKKQERQFSNIFKIWKDRKKNNKPSPFIIHLIFNNLFGRFTYNKTNEFGRKISGTTYLKAYCSPTAKIEVEKIEVAHYQSILKRAKVRALAGAVTSVATLALLIPMPYLAPVIIPFGAASILKTLS
nr:hypothetical protein [Parachlamydiaceae bacterium]